MRVLLVSQWYAPEPLPKMHGLARALQTAGHEVQVLTSFPNYPYGRIYPGYRQKPLKREVLEGVEVLRVPTFMDHSRSSVRRSLSYLSYVATASVAGVVAARKPDLVWAYMSPFHIALPARWLGTWARAPVVLDVQDLWPETLSATGFSEATWLHRIIGRMVRRLYRGAAAIVVPSHGFCTKVVEKGIDPSRVTVIPNWADQDLQAPIGQVAPADAAFLRGRFSIVFAGNLGTAQGLGTILDAAALLSDLPSVQIVFVGDGIELDSLQQRVEVEQIRNVVFLKRRPAADLPALLAHAGALLVHLRKDPIFAVTIPSKVMAYLSSGKPILCGVQGDATQLVERVGAGLCFPPDDAQAMAGAIRRLAALPPLERAAMGQAGRRAFEAEFSYAAVSDRYVRLLEDVVVAGRLRA